MGTLTPGATLIYESPDKGNTVYYREAGSSERKLVGYMASKPSALDEDILWRNIRNAAADNSALQKALDQCIVLYHLSTSTNTTPIFHHPV